MKPVRPLLSSSLLALCPLLFSAALNAQVPGNRVIITQAYGGGGDPHSPTLANDYVELYNPLSTAVDLSTSSIQYLDANAPNTVTAWSASTLTGTIYPNHYFLVQLHGGGSGGAALTPADAFGTIDPNVYSGQLALMGQTTPLPYMPVSGVVCPTVFISVLGYGPTNCVESGTNGGSTVVLSYSSNYAPAMYYNQADVRLQDSNGNYEDAGVNQFDFATTPITPNPHSSKFAYAWVLSSDGTANKVNGTGITTGVGANESETATPFSVPLNFGAIAVDANGNAWYSGAGQTVIAGENQANSAGGQFGGGGLSSPIGIAVDGLSNLWITNGGGSLSEFSTTGVGASFSSGPNALSPTSGFESAAGGTYSSPIAVAVDAAGSVWVADGGNNSVYEVIGAAAPTAPLSNAIANGTTGVRP